MFEKAIDVLAEQDAQKDVAFLLPDGKEAAFSQDFFSPITPKEGEVCSVDGGQGCVFDSPGARIEFIRVYGSVYSNGKKLSQEREEGVVVIKNVGGKIVASSEELDFTLEVADDDPELKLGKERVSLGAVATLARFHLECRLSKKLGGSCNLILRDGPLLGNNTQEEAALKGLASLPLAGLCKTSTLLANDGSSAISMIRARAPEGSWSYSLGNVEEKQVKLVLLNAEAKYVFRLDATMDAAADLLAPLSTDAAFPGYPFPLIEADRLARVSNKELSLLKTRLMSEAGSKWKLLEQLKRGSDAHSILDSM